MRLIDSFIKHKIRTRSIIFPLANFLLDCFKFLGYHFVLVLFETLYIHTWIVFLSFHNIFSWMFHLWDFTRNYSITAFLFFIFLDYSIRLISNIFFWLWFAAVFLEWRNRFRSFQPGNRCWVLFIFPFFRYNLQVIFDFFSFIFWFLILEPFPVAPNRTTTFLGFITILKSADFCLFLFTISNKCT